MAQKRWPNLPPQPISSTLAASIQDDLCVIPAISNCNTQRSNSFRERVLYIYIYIYLLLIYIQLHALCYYYVSLHTETWWCTEQWEGCLKLDVLVIRRHSYTGRSCNRRPGRLLQPTIRICLHNQDNNGNSERRAGDYFGQCDTYIYIRTQIRRDVIIP